MAAWTLGTLVVLAVLYAACYGWAFLGRFAGAIVIALVLEGFFHVLRDGKWRLRSGSSAVTAAILVLSVPPSMRLLPLFYGLLVAVFVAKLTASDEHALRLNAAMAGRLFLSLAFHEDIVNWVRPGLDTDGLTTATPLELWHGADQAMVELGRVLSGRIGGDWEGFYALVPGSPGDNFGILILLLGALLVWRGVMDWRAGVGFLAAFSVCCLILREPLVYNLSTGAVVFAAVYIANDPRTSPTTRSGRWLFGIIAGIVNACIRKYSIYSEGIMYAFLAANLLMPLLDRMAFRLRGRQLARRAAAAREAAS